MNDCIVLFLETAGYRNLAPEGNRGGEKCFVFAKMLSALLGTL